MAANGLCQVPHGRSSPGSPPCHWLALHYSQVGVEGTKHGKELRRRGMSCQAGEWGKGALEREPLRPSGLHPPDGQRDPGCHVQHSGLTIPHQGAVTAATVPSADWPPRDQQLHHCLNLLPAPWAGGRVSPVTWTCQHLHQRSRDCGHWSRQAS